ncbi:MAG TPA: YlbF family regulator [Candidatus Blautia intestinavium]|nr:YlbF family regulator [Candidatus Blautia intestinavium]
MDAIEKNIHTLLVSIKRSAIYQEYKKQEKILNENPELAERVSQFRADNFRLQNEGGRDNLFSMAEQLSRESAELRRIPQVNAYLDAELALCRLMQHVCRSLTAGIDMNIPPL